MSVMFSCCISLLLSFVSAVGADSFLPMKTNPGSELTLSKERLCWDRQVSTTIKSIRDGIYHRCNHGAPYITITWYRIDNANWTDSALPFSIEDGVKTCKKCGDPDQRSDLDKCLDLVFLNCLPLAFCCCLCPCCPLYKELQKDRTVDYQGLDRNWRRYHTTHHLAVVRRDIAELETLYAQKSSVGVTQNDWNHIVKQEWEYPKSDWQRGKPVVIIREFGKSLEYEDESCCSCCW